MLGLMKRIWIRVVVSLFSAVLLFILLFALCYVFPSPLQGLASTLMNWPPSWTFTWIRHERGMGPGPVWFFGPAILDIPVAGILFFVLFTLRARRHPHAPPET
jgi:hypothetical protein